MGSHILGIRILTEREGDVYTHRVVSREWSTMVNTSVRLSLCIAVAGPHWLSSCLVNITCFIKIIKLLD